MIDLTPVDTNESLGRDVKSQAIVNTDTSAYTAFIERKRKKEQEERRSRDLQERVAFLEKKLEEYECRLQRLEQNSATTA